MDVRDEGTYFLEQIVFHRFVNRGCPKRRGGIRWSGLLVFDAHRVDWVSDG